MSLRVFVWDILKLLILKVVVFEYMILHYLKVAIRNLLTHKTQTLISLFGLALAFACVVLASYWNHYERTYDAFQKNVDRIYRIRHTSENPGSYLGAITPGVLHLYLKEKYPEIEAACAIYNNTGYMDEGFRVSINGTVYPNRVTMQSVTGDALGIFDFEWVEGNKDLMGYKRGQIAISEHLAQSMCGNQSPLGLTLESVYANGEKEFKKEYEIVGVYKTRHRHSNLKFDIVEPRVAVGNWYSLGAHTYVLLKSGVNHENFIQKMQTDTVQAGNQPVIYGIVTPLKALRYTYPVEGVNTHLEDVNLFTVASVFLALCALINYLTLFVSRLRERGRDMAVRSICGSSGWQMSGLLLTEYLLLLLAASLVGMLFVELSMVKFMELAMIQIEPFSVVVSCGFLMLFSIVLSMLLSVVPILFFRRKTLRVQIEITSAHLRKDYFRSIGVCIQLIFGFLFVFCTVVMMRQVHTLIYTDSIVSKKIAWICTDDSGYLSLIQDVLRQQPFIIDFKAVKAPLYPAKFSLGKLNKWEGKLVNDESIEYGDIEINEEVAQFYGLKMKEGLASFELGEKEIFINETLARKLNMSNPIGKTVQKVLRIKGVVSDFQVQNPKMSTKPIMFSPFKSMQNSSVGKKKAYVAFKYDGEWSTCKNILQKELRDKDVHGALKFADGEEYYQSFLKSEYNLLKLLSVISIVSILIAIFGVYALMMQSCDQRQKEIAVRKVFGAKVKDILLMFFKQYMLQVVMAAFVAFPVGYFLMKNWMEQYTRQTDISIWIFLCIFLGMSLLVTLCIGWRVWKVANENPAVVIKKE